LCLFVTLNKNKKILFFSSPRVTLNNASDYRAIGLTDPNPNPGPLVQLGSALDIDGEAANLLGLRTFYEETNVMDFHC